MEYVDVEEFKLSLSSIKKYFRINNLKISNSEFEKIARINFSPTPIPFIKSLEEDISLGNTFEYYLGLIHPQSLSSSLVPLVLNPKKEDVVLDVTASPGSKTTQIAMQMDNKGAVVANDRRDRLSALLHNISRLSVINSIVISKDAKFPIAVDYFDKVLVDAPCTALGSHLHAWKRFNEDIAISLSRVQKRILLSAFDSLKEGGELVYSTCTITKEENEEVISFLLQERDAKLVQFNLDIPHINGLSDYGLEFKKVARIYPKHLKSEGFFIAKIKKI